MNTNCNLLTVCMLNFGGGQVDITKVKMDVIKPWIAKRVTEFLEGFEDELLINFIYGLLEGKVSRALQYRCLCQWI